MYGIIAKTYIYIDNDEATAILKVPLDVKLTFRQ